MKCKTHKNFVFRFHECGLSIEETEKLCLVNAREVTLWDEGKEIPALCKRVMRWAKCKNLIGSFENWRIEDNGRLLVSECGQRFSPQQILNAAYIERLYNTVNTRKNMQEKGRLLRSIRNRTAEKYAKIR